MNAAVIRPVLLFLLLAADAAFARELAPEKYPLDHKSRGAYVPYAASHDLSRPIRDITRVMVAVHSSSFDANAYLRNGQAAATKFPGALKETLIIAPHLLTKTKVPGDEIPDGMLYWKVSPFRGSQLCAIGPRGRPCRFSAYELLDEMLVKLTNRRLFPNLKNVVVVGHSAGGQFVQRYALAGKFEPPKSINIRFVVCAPSSFAYVTNERLVPGTEDRFAVPANNVIATCGGYDNWGYGLSKPYAYFRNSNLADLKKRFGQRNVYYLCGERDTNADDGTTSKTCAAMMQGEHRRERMEVFHKYLQHVYGQRVTARHKLAITPGVGHSGYGNMTSAAGVKFLFAPKP